MHFDEGLSARHRAGETAKLAGKGIRSKSASEKLTEEGLVKLSARAAIQVMREIYVTCTHMTMLNKCAIV